MLFMESAEIILEETVRMVELVLEVTAVMYRF